MQRRKLSLFSTREFIFILFFYGVFSIVMIYLDFYYLQVTNAQFILNIEDTSMLVGTSETVRMFSSCQGLNFNKPQSGNGDNDLKFRQWIAGIIDGDGNFYISKLGYVELSVTTEPRDIACLYKLKQHYGGSVKSTSHAKAVRFRLHHKAGILAVLKDINGLNQNPVRYTQVEMVCKLYDVPLLNPVPLTYNSAYLSGLFDADGSIYYNKASRQILISLSQKRRFILDLIASVYGGTVKASNKDQSAFKWTIYRKNDVLSLIDNYFHWNNCVSAKNKKFGLVKEFYHLSSIGALNASENSVLGKSFIQFANRWEATNNLNKDK
jgi:hypothetical protein